MPHRRRTRKRRDVGIGNANGFGKVVGKRAETGAEDEPNLRAQLGLRKHKCGGGFSASKQIWGHKYTFFTNTSSHPVQVVILSEPKDLLSLAPPKSRSFASLRMTTVR